MQAETALQNEIRLAISKAFSSQVVLFRNQTGRYQTDAGAWVTYGVGGPGASDLLGWATVDGIARFVAIEIKVPGQKPRKDQAHFLQVVQAAGGIAGCATSVDEALAILHGFIPPIPHDRLPESPRSDAPRPRTTPQGSCMASSHRSQY